MKHLWQRANLVDKLNYIYFTYITLLIVFFHNRIPNWSNWLIFNFFYLFMIALLVHYTKPNSNKILIFFRCFYQLFFLSLIYKETEVFMRVYHSGWMDPIITNIELSIFKVHPTHLLEKIANPILTEYLKFVYFSYFLLLPFFPLYLYFTKNKKGFYQYLFTMTLAMYLCYVGFMIIPVEGPRYFWSLFQFPHKTYYFGLIRNAQGFVYTVKLKGYFFTHLVNTIMSHGDATGACIPSAHNAAATVILFMSYKYFKKWFFLFLPLVLSIYISTVYNRYHYTTDMMTGIITGIVAIYIVSLFFKKDRKFIKK